VRDLTGVVRREPVFKISGYTRIVVSRVPFTYEYVNVIEFWHGASPSATPSQVGLFDGYALTSARA